MKRAGLLAATLRQAQPRPHGEYRGRTRIDPPADMVIGWGMVIVILLCLAVAFTVAWNVLPTLEPHPQVEVDG